MARRGPKPTWRFLLLLLIAAAVLWRSGQWEESPAAGPERHTPAAAPGTGGKYQTYTGCRLVDHRQNDGDSFRVRLPDGRVEQFRLYYVDAPESEFRTYAGGSDNHRRINEQAAALRISARQAVEIGKRAKQRVEDTLGRGSFTLHTAWDDPFNDRRYHAFIQAPGGPWLHEMLVREGLVRIHTKPADLPDGTPLKKRLRELRELENDAKRSGQGAWGAAGR